MAQTGAAADVYSNIGQTKQGFEQQGINEQLQKYAELQSSPFAGLGEYLGLVSGAAGKYGSTTTPIYGQGGSTFGSILGQGLGGYAGAGFPGLGTAAGGIGGLLSGGLGGGPLNLGALLMSGLPWSDKRLKKNIKFEGMEKGHRIYSFNYLWDNATRWIGVMAQDLLQYAPGFVHIFDKFYWVDYPALGIEMRRA